MKLNQKTSSKKIAPLQKLSIYDNAVELFTLSRKLKKDNLITNELIYSDSICEKIINATLSLPFLIAEATVTKDYSKKLLLSNHIEKRLQKLNCYCIELTQNKKSTNQDLKRLKQILQMINPNFKMWSLQLTQSN